MKKGIYILATSSLLCSTVLANDNFSKNKNIEVMVNSKTLKVREKPFVGSNALYSKKENDKFFINGCNQYGWCELTEGGYVPDFLLKADNFETNFKKEFNLNKNSIARVNLDEIDVRKVPYYKAEIIKKKRRNDLIEINGCDSFGWCELKDGGYIKTHLTKEEEKNNLVKVNIDKLQIFEQKDLNSKVIETKKRDEILVIEDCDNEGWCKVKNSGYFKKNLPKTKKEPEKIKEDKSDSLTIFKENENPVIDKYKQALTFYKNKDYKNSYKLFKELFEESLNDINTNFYLGRSAFELKKYTEALSAYERVLFERPDAIRTQYEMAKTFFLINDYKNAKEMFTQLLENKELKPKIKSNINRYLLSIEDKTKRHVFNNAFILGLGYDSNINNASSDDYFDIPNTSVQAVNTTELISDKFFEAALNINHTYLIDDQKSINNNFLVYSKTMFKYNDKDIVFLSYKPKLNIISNTQLQSSYGLILDNVLLDSKRYIMGYGINPKVNYTYDANNIFNLSLTYLQKKHQQNIDKNKDSKVWELKVENKHIYDDKNIITTEIKLYDEQKDKGPLAIDNNIYGLKLSNLYLYNNKINFIPTISYQYKKEKDIDSLYNKKEITKKLKLDFAANYLYNKNIQIRFAVNYEDNESNIPSSQYDKHGININIIRPF